MTSEEFAAMLERMAQGWSNRDHQAVVDQFAEKLFYSDALNYALYDKESLLRFFEDDGGEPQFCVFHNTVFDGSRQLGCAEYTYRGSFLYHGSVWIKIEGEKIVEWREYQHRVDHSWDEFWKK